MYLTDELFNHSVNNAMSTDRLSATFQALADPTRRAILARLALGETSVSELAEPFDISGPAISRHLKVLEHAGLIARGREAQWRPCRIELNALKGVDDWLEEYRRLWSAIHAGFALDPAGRPKRIAHPGYGPADAFYEGLGKANAINSCNVWAADRLRIAGVKASLWSPFAAGVVWRYRPADQST